MIDWAAAEAGGEVHFWGVDESLISLSQYKFRSIMDRPLSYHSSADCHFEVSEWFYWRKYDTL